ncbi:hypothetical protein GCM10028799_52600 [Kribbella italica]
MPGWAAYGLVAARRERGSQVLVGTTLSGPVSGLPVGGAAASGEAGGALRPGRDGLPLRVERVVPGRLRRSRGPLFWSAPHGGLGAAHSRREWGGAARSLLNGSCLPRRDGEWCAPPRVRREWCAR